MRFGSFTVGLALLASASLSDLRAVVGCGPQPTASNIEGCTLQIAEVDALALQARDAVSEDSKLAQSGVEALRRAGREGLERFLTVHKDIVEAHAAGNQPPSAPWLKVKAALDSIGGQYDCHASKLYWYTDLEQAKAAAQRTSKPILSLRLLGKLTDEFSCANSRFFRSTLYANQEVGEVLREKFVLHWQSVRPVPRVTIDFGDGRKLERTLTGNSVHYILDMDGQVVDALPGLYGPKAFLRGLAAAENQIAAMKDLPEAERLVSLQSYHAAAAKQALTDWQQDLAKLNLLPRLQIGATPKFQAAAANNASLSKGKVESAILVAALPAPDVLASATDDTAWGQIAALHQDDAQLDEASIAFMRMQNPRAALAGAVAVTKARVEDPMVRLVRAFQNTIGIDTVKNEYTLHRQLHEWFASATIAPNIDVKDLNERVYAQLFLTPSSDPWLGLMPGDVYTALDSNGVVQN